MRILPQYYVTSRFTASALSEITVALLATSRIVAESCCIRFDRSETLSREVAVLLRTSLVISSIRSELSRIVPRILLIGVTTYFLIKEMVPNTRAVQIPIERRLTIREMMYTAESRPLALEV